MTSEADWFTRLAGFREGPYQETQRRLRFDGDRLLHADGERSWGMGRLETPTLAELRERVKALPPQNGGLRVSIVQGAVQEMHADASHRHALFQAASQFNLLEMVDPGVPPEAGVTRSLAVSL